MGQVLDVAEEAGQARAAMVEKMIADGDIRSSEVEAAFRRVSREAFMPSETSLLAAYNAADSVTTKRDAAGVIISSVSAPFIQARMLEQAELRPGMRVLEVGSGGCNAALIAEVVGRHGRVVSVDIDPEIVANARELLATAGYGDRVRVLVGDADHGVPGEEPFDAVVITVGAWDVSPALVEQLTAAGRLVVPLRMNGITRSIGFRRAPGHLVSTSAEVCGFVPAQGVGGHADRTFHLPAPSGGSVTARFETGVPAEPSRLDGVLAAGRSQAWSGVLGRRGTSFADLTLWFACYLPGFCRVGVEDKAALVGDGVQMFPYGAAVGDSLAVQIVRLAGPEVARPVGEGARPGDSEFGACGFGPHAGEAAAAMVEATRAWDRTGRAAPRFSLWPAGTDWALLPAGAAVLTKTHQLVAIEWPGGMEPGPS
ncbi:methyltransferase, FxLD system [Frankia saprophytica]|uniref:methyltransferase, FxLD system n=1 Tax=Pseudofrankia saprophytica TaxID=298655 RepID=UPI000234C144